MVKKKHGQLSVLHQNVQSISNKLVELDLMLKSSLGNIDALFYRTLGEGGLFELNSD